MKRIQRLSQLRDCGVFRNFSWPSGLPEFGKCNLIYGWNGTGKTTLSRLLRDLELNRSPGMGEATLKIDGRKVKSNEFPDEVMQIRVFNRDFVQENVFSTEGSNIPPILVLGAENVEKQKEMERLAEQRSVAQAKLNEAQDQQRAAQKHFDNYCRDRARVIKDTLRVSGESPFNNYDMTNFKDDAASMVKAGDSATHRLVGTERDELIAQHQATPKQKLDEVRYTLPDFEAIVNSISNLSKMTVVSETIEALTNAPALADWTRQGLTLHQDRSSQLCQFCEQPLPKGRIAALEKHFNDQYEQFIQRIDKEIEKLKAAYEASKELELPASAELYDKFSSEFQSRLNDLEEALQLMRNFTETAVQALREKKARVFEQVNLAIKAPSLDSSVIEKLNSVISQHNKMTDDFNNYVKKAREKLANGMVAACLEEFVHRKTAIHSASKNAKEENGNVDRLNREIEDLERQIVEHRQPAEELNEDIKKYLGHGELCLEIKENGYSVTRSGVPTKTLSEGEITAVALLYFLKSLKDRRFSLDSGIVVLDDPVSSLDANALFLAFGFIRERTADVGQLLILTHNFSWELVVRGLTFAATFCRVLTTEGKAMNLFEIFTRYPDHESCIEHLERIRFAHGDYCPHCGGTKVARKADGHRVGRWNCHDCHSSFNVLSGTIFQKTKVELQKWFAAIGLIVNAKKSLSSCQLARDLDLNQKTAWYMQTRIRSEMATKEGSRLMRGIVEADETYIGGKPRGRKGKNKRGRGTKKTAVLGAVERGGIVAAKMTDSVSGKAILAFINENVDPAETVLMTDEFRSYRGVRKTMRHGVIKHSQGIYAEGITHTNTIEGYWALLKRAWYGSHHHYSKQFTPLYIAEQSWKYNNRANKDAFGTFLAGCFA